MRKLSCILGFCTLLISSGCLEEFTPEIDEATDAIVVEGKILQGTHGAEVRLTRSFDFDKKVPIPILNAHVGIQDDQGNVSILRATELGVYESDTTELQGIPGRSYQLFVEIPPNIRLESEWMKMEESAELQNTRWEFQEKEMANGTTKGAQIYLDAFEPEGKSNFYRWEYEETWEFRVPYPATGIWNTQTNIPEPIDYNDRPHTCWKHVISSDIHIGSTEGLVGNRIADFPIKFVPVSETKLYIKYSILIKQYTISPQTHEFWRRLKGVTEELGSLYDPVPTEVEGNIHSTGAGDIPVLGFFSADGYQENRLFISRRDLPPVGVPSGFADCVYDTVPRSEVNTSIIQGKLYVEDVLSIFGTLIGFAVTQARCADCTLSGSPEKPDFWD